jgi:hypothetical protein
VCDNFDGGIVDAALDSTAKRKIASYVSTAENPVETLLATSLAYNLSKENSWLKNSKKNMQS